MKSPLKFDLSAVKKMSTAPMAEDDEMAEEGEEEDEDREKLKGVAGELMSAIKSGDEDAVADALLAAYHACRYTREE